MAKIYNSDVTKGLAQNAAIQQNVDRVPNELAEKIVPTLETNPLMLRRTTKLIRGVFTLSGSSNVLTSSSSKDTYVTFISASYMKDAACDVATGNISIGFVLETGETQYLSFPVITLTAEKGQLDLSFPFPIKIQRGSNITFSGTFTAGTMTRNCTIGYYEVDNVRA